MQMLIIRTQGEADKVFELFGEDVEIGRTRYADLVLDSPSVSRKHASLRWDSGRYSICDADSNNGVWVNREQVTQRPLDNGDRVRLGEYELLYIDGPLPHKYRELDVPSMVHWNPVSIRNEDYSTQQLSMEAMQRLTEARRHLEFGELIDDDGERWLLGEDRWTMGARGQIPVKGVFMGWQAAELNWNGRNHVIRRAGRFASVRVDGISVPSASLENGDEIEVGKSRFHYRVFRPAVED